MVENLYICSAMKIGRHNWVVKCTVICLALMCWNWADGLATEKNHENDSCLEIMGLSSAYVEADVDILSSSELTCHSCSSTSARTLAKAHRQHSTKHSKYGFAQFRWGKSASEFATFLYLKSITNFPPGLDDSKPLFICLRRLLL